MRKKIAFVVILFLVMMSPISARAQAPLPPVTTSAVSMEEVHRFMDEYKSRYAKMDLDAFMALFSKEAVQNRMLPYEDIRNAYGKVFANSNSIQYNLEIYSIQTYQKSAFVSGRYELVQFLKGKNKRRVFRGDIQWNLIRENGALRIKEIDYGRDYSK